MAVGTAGPALAPMRGNLLRPTHVSESVVQRCEGMAPISGSRKAVPEIVLSEGEAPGQDEGCKDGPALMPVGRWRKCPQGPLVGPGRIQPSPRGASDAGNHSTSKNSHHPFRISATKAIDVLPVRKVQFSGDSHPHASDHAGITRPKRERGAETLGWACPIPIGLTPAASTDSGRISSKPGPWPSCWPQKWARSATLTQKSIRRGQPQYEWKQSSAISHLGDQGHRRPAGQEVAVLRGLSSSGF